MITATDFAHLIELLGTQAAEDIAWAEGIKPPTDADDFALECIFVICNSGMKNTIARDIYARVVKVLHAGKPASDAFGHGGKAAAIDQLWQKREMYFDTFKLASDKLNYLGGLPWIGNITKYHLAKNFGLDVAKPDVHLQRLADHYRTTPQKLCEALAKETGYRVATVDTVLWRACANGVLNSRTGEIA